MTRRAATFDLITTFATLAREQKTRLGNGRQAP